MTDISKLSIKSQMLYSFKSNEEQWENVSIREVLEREGKIDSEYWVWTCRFYLMELSTNGLIEPIDRKEDDSGLIGSGHSLTKYKLTDYGRYKIESMLE